MEREIGHCCLVNASKGDEMVSCSVDPARSTNE